MSINIDLLPMRTFTIASTRQTREAVIIAMGKNTTTYADLINKDRRLIIARDSRGVVRMREITNKNIIALYHHNGYRSMSIHQLHGGE